MDLLSVDVPIDTCVYNTPVNEDYIYTVEVSVSNIIGSTKTTADPFSKFIIVHVAKILYLYVYISV